MRKILILILGLICSNLQAQELLKAGGFKTSGATSGQTIKWNGTTWIPGDDLGSTADGVLDSAAFRAYNVVTAPKYIIMTDSLRGGKFRRTYTATADQYMVFTDALSRKWERFDYPFVTPEMFGSRGGTNQDSLPLTRAFNWPKKDVLLTRPYYSSAPLTLTESKTIYGNHATIKLKTVISSSTPNISLTASDVRIVDLTIKGLIATQTGEWSAGIQLSGSSTPTNNIVLENLNIRDTRGDGVYIATTSLKRGNVNIINVHTNNCMRNGMTITAGDNLHIDGFTADSVSLIGIDLEPDVITQVARNVLIENIHVPSIAFGTHEDTLHKNITVRNFIIDNSKRGSSVSYVDGSLAHKIGINLRGTQNASFENGTIKNTKLYGIFFSTNSSRPCKNISFDNVFMVDNYTTGTDFWIGTEQPGERISFNNCEFKGSSTYPFFTNVDAKWDNCKFLNFGTTIVNFGGVFDNCTSTTSSRFCYVPATPLTIRNCTITATDLLTPDAGGSPVTGELINNTLTLSGDLIGGTLKNRIIAKDNIINGRYFDLVSSGMTIRQSWLVKKTSGAMNITIPQWLGANNEFVLTDSIRNGVTTITGDFVGASSFATDGYSSYRFTYSGNVWHPEISSLNTPLSTIRQEGATTGQAVTWNGSAWAAGNPTASLTLTNKQVGYGNPSNVLVGNNKLQFDDGNTHLEIGDGSNVEYALKLKRTASAVTTGEEISLYANNSPTLQRILGGYSNGELSGTSYSEANPAIDVFVPAARYRMFGRINVAGSTAFNNTNVLPILTMMTNTGYAGIGLGYGVDPSTNFHINGNLRVTGTIKDSNNEDGTSGQVLSTTGTGTDWIAPPSGVIDLTVTGTSSPLTLNSSNGTDVTFTAGTAISLTGTTSNITINNTQTEVNGIYTGSGTIPNNTNATATDDFTITTADATGTQSPKFRVVASGTDPGVQVWKVGNDSLQLSFISGEPTLEAIGTSGDFWINSIGNDLRLGNGSTGVFTHTTKNVLGGYLALPYVQTASSITVSEGTAEVDVIGTSGTITLTFDNTSNLLGSAAKTITVRNRGAFNVTLSRGSQSWQWSDMTGTNTASNQTLAAGETAKMLWVDGGVTDYYVLHKMPNLFTGGSTNLAVTGSSSPLTLTSDTGTDVTFTAGTNVTLAGTSGNITISAAGGGDILNGGNSAGGTVTIGTNDNNVLSLETNNVTRLSIANGTTTGGIITATNVNANTSSPVDALILSTNSTGTGATGFGTGILFKAESNTTNDRDVARITGFYTDATNATSSTALTIDLKDAGTFAETYRFEPLGNLKVGQVSPTSFGKANITSGVDFTVGNSANLLTLGGSTGLVTMNSSASGSAVKINASGTSSYIEVGGTTASTITSGNKSNMDFPQGFTASSGTGNMNNIILSGTINQSGTATGELAGLHVNHTITAGVNYRGVYIDADGGTNSKGVYQTGSSMTNNFVGNTFFGATTSPTAMLHLGAGTTTLAPFKFTAGTNLTTPAAGAMEWDGTNLFVTQTSGPTRKQIAYTTDITGGSTNLAITGTSSPLTLTSDTGTDVTLTAGTGVSLTGTSGNVTINNTGIVTEVDGSISNEGSLTVAAGTGTTSVINSNTSGQTGVTLTAGTGLSISETGNVITLANTGIITEVDGSTSNELQTIANTSDATSHTVTLSNSGGSIQLVEGSGITLTTTGTSGAGVVTIASSGGSGDIVNGGNTTGPVIVGTNNNSATSLETNNVTRLSIASGASTGGQTTLTTVTANTTTADDALTITTSSSGTPTNGFGTGILFTAENATFSDAQLARIKPYYIDANNNSSVSALSLELSSGGSLSERFRFETTAFGTLKIGSQTPVSMTNVGIIPTADYGINTTTANNTTIGGGTGRVFINSAQQGNGVNINVTDPTYGSVTIGQDVNGILENTSTVTQERPSLEIKQSFVTASGGNQHTSLLLSPTINQTSSAFGVVRGIRINPTLTALTTAYRSVDIGANNALAKGIYQTGALTTNNLVGNTYFGSTSAPTALVHVAAGTATVAPMILTSGTNLTTPVAGAIEWNGTNLFATQTSGPTRRTVAFTSDFGSETIITPSQLTSDQNDWNPTSLSTATLIRINGDASFRSVTGITAPTTDKTIKILNVGSNSLAFLRDHTSSTAANRFDMLKDEVLLPGESMEIYYDLTASRWKLMQHVKTSVGRRVRRWQYVPSATSTSAEYHFTWSAGSGAAAAITGPSSTNDVRGANLVLGTGTTTTGAAYLSNKSLSAYLNGAAATESYFGMTMYIPTASDATNTYAAEAGLKASATIGTSTNGVFFRYTHSENSGNWQIVSTVSGTPSTTNTSVAGVPGTTQTLELFKRPNGTVVFYIDGVAQGSISYSGTIDLQPVALMTKSAGTTNRTFETSFVEVENYNK